MRIPFTYPVQIPISHKCLHSIDIINRKEHESRVYLLTPNDIAESIALNQHSAMTIFKN